MDVSTGNSNADNNQRFDSQEDPDGFNVQNIYLQDPDIINGSQHPPQTSSPQEQFQQQTIYEEDDQEEDEDQYKRPKNVHLTEIQENVS